VRRDLQDLIRRAIAHGLEAFIEASRCQNYQKTTGLIGNVAPTMPGSPWNGNAGTHRSVEHLIFEQDPISAGEHHEMLRFIAVNRRFFL